jgi:hypothetical protein
MVDSTQEDKMMTRAVWELARIALEREVIRAREMDLSSPNWLSQRLEEAVEQKSLCRDISGPLVGDEDDDEKEERREEDQIAPRTKDREDILAEHTWRKGVRSIGEEEGGPESMVTMTIEWTNLPKVLLSQSSGKPWELCSWMR